MAKRICRQAKYARYWSGADPRMLENTLLTRNNNKKQFGVVCVPRGVNGSFFFFDGNDRRGCARVPFSKIIFWREMDDLLIYWISLYGAQMSSHWGRGQHASNLRRAQRLRPP